jgi:hypothetical protein
MRLPRAFPSPGQRLMKRMGEELPLCGMIMMNSGKLTYGMLDGVLMMINGRALRGMRKLLTEFWRTRNSIDRTTGHGGPAGRHR